MMNITELCWRLSAPERGFAMPIWVFLLSSTIFVFITCVQISLVAFDISNLIFMSPWAFFICLSTSFAAFFRLQKSRKSFSKTPWDASDPINSKRIAQYEDLMLKLYQATFFNFRLIWAFTFAGCIFSYLQKHDIGGVLLSQLTILAFCFTSGMILLLLMRHHLIYAEDFSITD